MAEHDHSAIKEDMTVVGADGVHVGTVDHLEGERIKLTKADSGDGKHHYLPAGLVACPRTPPMRSTCSKRPNSRSCEQQRAGRAIGRVGTELARPFPLGRAIFIWEFSTTWL